MAQTFNPNMSNKEVANLILQNYKDKSTFLNVDFANVTTTGLEATREFAIGGWGAPNRVAFDGQRTGTLTIQTQIATMKLFSMLAGRDVDNTFEYVKRIVITAEGNKLTIPDDVEFVDGSINVYSVDDDCGTSVEITATDKEITLPTDSTGDYAVYGMIKVEGAQTVRFNSTDFPKAYTIYGDVPWKTEDDEVVEMKLAYYKAVPQSTFELAFNNTAIIDMSITFDLLADDQNRIYDMSIVG